MALAKKIWLILCGIAALPLLILVVNFLMNTVWDRYLYLGISQSQLYRDIYWFIFVMVLVVFIYGIGYGVATRKAWISGSFLCFSVAFSIAFWFCFLLFSTFEEETRFAAFTSPNGDRTLVIEEQGCLMSGQCYFYKKHGAFLIEPIEGYESEYTEGLDLGGFYLLGENDQDDLQIEWSERDITIVYEYEDIYAEQKTYTIDLTFPLN